MLMGVISYFSILPVNIDTYRYYNPGADLGRGQVGCSLGRKTLGERQILGGGIWGNYKFGGSINFGERQIFGSGEFWGATNFEERYLEEW